MSGGWLPPSDAPPPEVSSWPTAPPLEEQRTPAVAGGTPAGWGARAGAAGLDFLVRLGIVAAFAAVGAILFVAGTDAGVAGLIGGAIIGAIVSIAYAPYMIATRNGQTIGHRATNTRVVRADGSPLSGGQAFVREFVVKGLLFETVGQFTLYLLTIVNYLWPLWDDKNEALHDKLTSTRVVEA